MTAGVGRPAEGSPVDWGLLKARALEAMRNAYAPYSRFRVGAAILAADGTVTAGCNVENASYPAGICGERTAVAAAVSAGARTFLALVIVTEADHSTPPCGICRQVLQEFAPELPILSVSGTGEESRWTLAELLPYAFNPSSLGRR